MSKELLPYNGARPIKGETGFLVFCHRCDGYQQVRVRWSLDVPPWYRRDWQLCPICDGQGVLPRLRYNRPDGAKADPDDFTPRKFTRHWSAHEYIQTEHDPEFDPDLKSSEEPSTQFEEQLQASI